MQTIAELFNSFKNSAFRFESLPEYSIPEERAFLESYRRGDPVVTQLTPGHAEWTASIKKWKTEGKSVQRLRMLPAKFSSYVSCEIDWAYPFNVAAGEELYVIPETEVCKLGQTIPPDFWVFDSQHVSIFQYTDKGEWVGAQTLTEKADFYVKLTSQLLNKATPYTTYLSIIRSQGSFP